MIRPIHYHPTKSMSPIKKTDSIFFTALWWIGGLSLIVILSTQNFMESSALNSQVPLDALPSTFPILPIASPLSLCNSMQVVPTTEFAIVSTLPMPPIFSSDMLSDFYIDAALVLGHSVRTWTNLDLLLLAPSNHPLFSPHDANHNQAKHGRLGNWMLCDMQMQQNKYLATDMVEFLHTRVKLSAWKLIEYKAILLMDLDMLVVNNPSSLFTMYYPLMQQTNKSVASISHTLCDKSLQQATEAKRVMTFTSLHPETLLLIPSQTTYLHLRKRQEPSDMGKNTTLQSFSYLVNHFFSHAYYELPMEYNANIKWKICDPVWWHNHKTVILHFTVAKPWSFLNHNLFNFGTMHPWACWITGLSDLCNQWKAIWMSVHN